MYTTSSAMLFPSTRSTTFDHNTCDAPRNLFQEKRITVLSVLSVLFYYTHTNPYSTQLFLFRVIHIRFRVQSKLAASTGRRKLSLVFAHRVSKTFPATNFCGRICAARLSTSFGCWSSRFSSYAHCAFCAACGDKKPSGGLSSRR